MKKYWIIVNKQPAGPFTAEELKMRRDFTAELPVWFADLADWSTVGQVPELAALLHAEPAEAAEAAVEEVASAWVHPAQAPVANVEKPRTYIVWNIVLLLLANMLCGIIGIIFGTMVSRRWYAGDYEGAQKASNGAVWCIMIGIVLGLISWPFQLLVPYII